MKDTISTIASRTGVSVSTVSRVLSGKYAAYRISEATAELVRAEAQRCNFSPNRIAQGLRAGHTDTIGLVLPGVDNPFFATLACTVIEFLKNSGYHTILADSQESEEEERNAVQTFLSRNVDGIIVAPAGEDPSFLEEVARDVPVILIDRYFSSTSLPYVSTANAAGGRMAARLFLDKGFKRILSIQGVPWSMPNRERKAGFSAELQEAGGIIHEVRGNAFSVENGYRVTMDEFGGKKKYDAIFAYSSTILLGAIRALRELGLQVPGDVSIISFDNNGFFDFLDPPVTRIEQPLKAIGRLAVETLLGRIRKDAAEAHDPGSTDSSHMLITPELVVRSSC